MPVQKVVRNGKTTYRVEVNYNYRGEYKKKTKVGIKTKAEANKIYGDLLQEVNANAAEKLREIEDDYLNKTTLDDLVNEYLEDFKAERRASTLDSTRRKYENRIKPYLGSKIINQISLADFKYWKKSIETLKLKGKPLKLGYKKNLYNTFSALLRYAERFHGYNLSFFKRIGNFVDPNNFSRASDRINFWTIDEFKAFITELRRICEENDSSPDGLILWGYYVFYNILYFCGLRKGEAFALTWDKIIKKFSGTWVVDIRHSQNQKIKGDDGEYTLTAPKTQSGMREIPLCQELRRVLKEHYERYQHVYGFNPSFYICGGLNPVTSSKVGELKKKIEKKLGLKHIRIHDFKHSFVSMLIHQNVNIKTISVLAGHASVDITWNIYGHLYPEDTANAIKEIDKLF